MFYQLFVRQAPILGGSSEAYEESLFRQKEELSLQKNGGNVRSEDKGDKFMSKSFLRAWYYGQNTTIALCNEKTETTSASLHTSTGLHHNDPYLRLGPFKYQLLSSSPHVAIFRDFFSAAECDGFIQRARNNLQSTPYQAPLKSGGCIISRACMYVSSIARTRYYEDSQVTHALTRLTADGASPMPEGEEAVPTNHCHPHPLH